MKTTVDLPDELLVSAKKLAAERRVTLKALITRGLREVLAAEEIDQPEIPRREIRWVTVDGDLAPGLKLDDRAAMNDWLADQR